MKLNTHLRLALIFLAMLTTLGPAHAQNYADAVVNYSGLDDPPYDNPNAVLGQPTTLVDGGSGTYHASMVYAPYNTDPQGNDLIAATGTGGYVTIRFDAPIVHSDQHWYGDDFILFGNPFFSGSVLAGPATDMTQDIIAPNAALYQNGVPSVSVSADGTDGSFVPVSRQGIFYPTNPYTWAGITPQNPSGWDDAHLNDFTKPVNPALKRSDFGSKSVAYAANTLYDGSAGGAAYSLAGVLDNAGLPLTSVQYIRFTGTGGSSVVDAVSRVSNAPLSAPEPAPLLIFTLGALGLALLRFRLLAISRS